MDKKRLLTGRQLLIFGLFAALFHFPLLSAFNKPGTVGGIPILYIAILVLWLLLVLVLYFQSKTGSDTDSTGRP